jgi:hypothetical protein
MKHRFLIHSLNHTTLLVDITPAGIPNEILPPEGKVQTRSSLHFQGWAAAEKYLMDRGANGLELQRLKECLKKSSAGVVTIH